MEGHDEKIKTKEWSNAKGNVDEDEQNESSEEIDYSPKPDEHAEADWGPMTLPQLYTQLRYQYPPPKPDTQQQQDPEWQQMWQKLYGSQQKSQQHMPQTQQPKPPIRIDANLFKYTNKKYTKDTDTEYQEDIAITEETIRKTKVSLALRSKRTFNRTVTTQHSAHASAPILATKLDTTTTTHKPPNTPTTSTTTTTVMTLSEDDDDDSSVEWTTPSPSNLLTSQPLIDSDSDSDSSMAAFIGDSAKLWHCLTQIE